MEHQQLHGQDTTESQVRPDYEPPTLVDLGSLTDLTQGAFGASDGLGPGSAFG